MVHVLVDDGSLGSSAASFVGGCAGAAMVVALYEAAAFEVGAGAGADTVAGVGSSGLTTVSTGVPSHPR